MIVVSVTFCWVNSVIFDDRLAPPQDWAIVMLRALTMALSSIFSSINDSASYKVEPVQAISVLEISSGRDEKS